MIEFNLSTSELDEYRQTARDFRSDKTIETKHHAIPHVNSAMKYPAGDEWHEGYVDDVCIIGQDGNEKSALYNTIGSRVDAGTVWV